MPARKYALYRVKQFHWVENAIIRLDGCESAERRSSETRHFEVHPPSFAIPISLVLTDLWILSTRCV